jgi:KamA family protein
LRKSGFSQHIRDARAHAVPFRAFTERNLDQIEPLARLSDEQQFAIRVVAQVLPFRVNQYVIDHLIDWEAVPEDPMFRLVFPQPEMLSTEHFDRIGDLLRSEAERSVVKAAAREIHQELNPHPAGQQTLNLPRIGNEVLHGSQHKYRETLLFFPSQGQTCHAYCTFCFRWPQFVQNADLKIASREVATLHEYLQNHEEISDLLVTGGDPMVMKASRLADYLKPLTDPAFDHVRTIRIGTKSLTYWPHRFVGDPDADDVLRLFADLIRQGKHVAVMAHFEHGRELRGSIVRRAVRRILDTGTVIRTQAPVLRHVNDDPDVWATMWRKQVRLGMAPYYMFVERDTGPKQYFELPLERTWHIYREAIQQVSGLARTARGPSMSAAPGKVEVQGVADVAGEKVFVLRMLQARNPDWVQRPFFAKYDPAATWLDDLQPAFGEERFFFEAQRQSTSTTPPASQASVAVSRGVGRRFPGRA